jgi:hypothetical protein
METAISANPARKPSAQRLTDPPHNQRPDFTTKNNAASGWDAASVLTMGLI